ncbi:MAG: serine acetyltransferase [Deltaproteobacteria bacterium]|nr:serine acetyltransferase [Deltaproteobacteria bacterium]
MEEPGRKDECKVEISTAERFREKIPNVVQGLVLTCERDECFDHVSPEPLPSRETIIGLIEQGRRILFPGYFLRGRVDRFNLQYYYGQEVTDFFDSLAREITLSIRHDCLRYDQPCSHCLDRGHEAAMDFIRELPGLRGMLGRDVLAAWEGDPAAQSHDEIIFSYPGLFAVTVHRMAHQLYDQGVPLIPRIMSEYAHGVTGIDIHPGAHIGQSFFIDHGTGVVIGETARIGDRVRIYQGVTLGALSLPRDEVKGLRNAKRHPTIEDDVVIYAGATILGGDTVIGARSVIGGNVWITDSVPPDTRVFLKRPELIIKGAPARGPVSGAPGKKGG